jgi:ATP-dependent DNA helicase RecQ
LAIFDIIEKKLSYRYYVTDPYYPQRYYDDSDLNEEEIKFRRIIWEFKEGNNSDSIAEALSEGIGEIKEITNNDEWTLCCIPSSTAMRTQIKYNNFCEVFCRITNISNGFAYISNKYYREARKLEQKGIFQTKDLNFSKDIIDRKILLFDDLISDGETFLSIAEHLKSLGAKEIVGMMLGKVTCKKTKLEQITREIIIK